MWYFMWNVLFMCNVLYVYLGQWHIWLCILLIYNICCNCQHLFYAVFWSNDSQCAEGHLSHVHWLWRLRNQIIDVLASNLELDIYWILHVKICIICRINPRTLFHSKGHRPEGWYRSRVDMACDTDFDM